MFALLSPRPCGLSDEQKGKEMWYEVRLLIVLYTKWTESLHLSAYCDVWGAGKAALSTELVMEKKSTWTKSTRHESTIMKIYTFS